jgi:acetolactate synthase-1/2/3 large subunit
MPGGTPRSGYYHENDQQAACTSFVKARAAVESVTDLIPELDRLWFAMQDGRPGPALLDVTGPVFAADAANVSLPPFRQQPATLGPSQKDVDALARLVASWRKPLILAGGGVITAGATGELRELANRLGAPIFNSLMGKCALPTDHPLAAGMPWRQSTSDTSDMASRISPLFTEADGLLALGCRFGQIITGSWAMRPPASIAQVDIDASEFGRHYPVTLGVRADVREAVQALLRLLPPTPRTPWAAPRPKSEPWRIAGMDLPSAVRRALPRETIVVADVTQLGYRMLVEFPVFEPRTFLHPAGAVSMGYGLPAAIAVKAAFPDRPVVTVMGDGCFQMSGMELATSVQEKLPVVVLLVNDSSLTLIKAIQQRRFGSRFIGVDLKNPDFGLFAKAFGVHYWAADSEATLENALREAIACGVTALVELRIAPQ